MPETWGLGQLVAFVRQTSEQNPRLGRALVLFGFISLVGGAGVLVVTETFRMTTGDLWTFRRLAGGIGGIGLPAFLYGVVVLSTTDAETIDLSGTGALLCTLAVVGFLVTSPGQWNGAGVSAYAFGTVVVYGLGGMTCSFAAGMAVCSGVDSTDEPGDETGVLRGSPPES